MSLLCFKSYLKQWCLKGCVHWFMVYIFPDFACYHMTIPPRSKLSSIITINITTLPLFGLIGYIYILAIFTPLVILSVCISTLITWFVTFILIYPVWVYILFHKSSCLPLSLFPQFSHVILFGHIFNWISHILPLLENIYPYVLCTPYLAKSKNFELVSIYTIIWP